MKIAPPPFGVMRDPMGKPLRSRSIDLCLEENGDLFAHGNRRAEIYQLPSGKRVGVTFYSGVRSREAYSLARLDRIRSHVL